MAVASELSPEVQWYLDSRGYVLPEKHAVPLWRTEEPGENGELFDADRVDKVIQSLRVLKHTKGRWAGQALEPTPVQVAYFIAPIFGWVHENSEGVMVRVIQEAYIEMPRKSAKTTLASGFGMYLAFADGEAGAEVVFGAASKDQAGAAFRPVESLARASKVLQRAGIVATKTHITQAATTSTLKVVSSRGDLAHGANIHGALIDELHVHKNPDLLEAIESGTGAREQPLTIIITTADDGQVVGTYAQRRDMVEKVCNGILKQSATYAIIFAASDTDDPFAESTWRKSNPLYPVTPSPEFMRKAADKAKSNPVAMASFLRLHLGIRAKQGSRYISLEHWKKAGLTTFKEGSLLGRLAYGGLDLASVSDLTALAWLFPDDVGGYDALYRFWLPEAALEALDGATARMASAWVADGWITLTPGDVVDYDWIKSTIVEDSLKFRVAEIGYDRWNSSQMVIDLQDKEGMPMTKVGQGVQSMSPALKELDRLVRLGRFHAGDNPVMLWMIDNLRVASDPAGNIKPDKAKSLAKIDGVSATLDALFCAMNSDYVQEAESAYETGSLTVV